MKTEHTPGPWHVEVNSAGVVYIKHVNDYVADVASRLDGINNDVRKAEQEANARLIAAAPELLAALEELWDIAKDVPSVNKSRPVLCNQVRAALAKAKEGV